MSADWALVAMALASVGSLIFSTLTYSLRDVSRARLADYLERHHRTRLLDPLLNHIDDLVFVTAVGRLMANTLIVLASFWICQDVFARPVARDLATFFLAAVITLFFSVTFPQALTFYAGDVLVGASAGLLNVMRLVFSPLSWVMHATDRFVRNATGVAPPHPEQIEQEIEEDILSAVEEGEERGVVDEQEREMIESAIEFQDSTAGQVMTARADMVSLDLKATLNEVKRVVEESGHSRIPVHQGTVDQIVGVLYARDLLKYLGQPPDTFDLHSALRPAYFVPETTPLGDLLHDFRKRKVHIAIVLDEYGGTTGLVTIQDILEQLVGDISDEHEPVEPEVFRRINESTFEADARIDVEEFNRLAGLNLPEDAGYTTLGGFVLSVLGRIPEAGVTFEQNGVKYTVLDAEPQRVNRVKVEPIHQAAER